MNRLKLVPIAVLLAAALSGNAVAQPAWPQRGCWATPRMAMIAPSGLGSRPNSGRFSSPFVRTSGCGFSPTGNPRN